MFIMMNKEKNYKQYQILDFDPDICGVEDGISYYSHLIN